MSGCVIYSFSKQTSFLDVERVILSMMDPSTVNLGGMKVLPFTSMSELTGSDSPKVPIERSIEHYFDIFLYLYVFRGKTFQ